MDDTDVARASRTAADSARKGAGSANGPGAASMTDAQGHGSPARPPEFLYRLVPARSITIFVRLASSFEISHCDDRDLLADESAWLPLTAPSFWEGLDGEDLHPVALAGVSGPRGTVRVARSLRDGNGVAGGLLCLVAETVGDTESDTESDTAARAADLVAHLATPAVEEALLLLARSWSHDRELEHLRLFHAAFDDALPYGFLVVDALGRVCDLGGRAERILGVSRPDAIGRDCALVLRPAGWDGGHPLLDELRGGADGNGSPANQPRETGSREPGASVELYITQPGGYEVPISLQTHSSEDGPDQTRRVLAVFRDLSEERSLEEAERQKDRLAVIGELSAGVAHEIRNPLTGIANCAQVLREDLESDDPHQRFLRIILDEVARLNRIVEGLLNYARPSHPELRESNMEECVERAIDLLRPDLEAKGIRVRTQTRGRIPLIYVDASQIEQVLLNLVRNAQEAMSDGGELTVECSVIRRLRYRRRTAGRRATDRMRVVQEGPRQRFVQIQVSDTGAGIPPHVLPRIFNPFFTTRSKGTGLGLSLCQSIVQEHGGFLTVRSVEKKGTTFLLDLPVERRQGERRKSE